jgi:hypothetical protein
MLLYTVIHRLGLFHWPGAVLPWSKPLFRLVFKTYCITTGLAQWHLDQLWPGVTDHAVVSLLIYLVLLRLAASDTRSASD